MCNKEGSGQIKLAELIKDPEIKAVLDELRLTKKKVQGLQYALADSDAEAKAEEDKS